MASKEILRDDLLILLSSMGIVLPDTKLSADELSKKVGLAFDASQQICTHLFADATTTGTTGTSTTPIDPNAFPPWDSSKKLFEATQRQNASEIHEGVMERPKQGRRAKKEETFKEMRQSIMGIAYLYDQDMREIFYVDENGKGILLKVLDVRRVNKDVPFFLFEYQELSLIDGAKYPAEASVPILDLERRALLKLFRRNTKKLREDGQREGAASHCKSFVLPLCPLNMQTLGKLTYNTGCQVCGKKNGTSRCLQCLSVVYCSKECQKKDWPEHKLACKSLKGGTWSTIKLSNQGKHRTIINRFDSLSTGCGSGNLKDDHDDSRDEIHKRKIFLAKFQIALTGSVTPHMMIYDRQRSFQVWWMRESNPTIFDGATKLMAGQYKFYKWVRRLGEEEMEVCFDRSPARDPVW